MLIVQKYGGSSVASAQLIKNVADRIIRRRQQGDQVVAVVSAMGDSTDELLALAASVSDDPAPRELDMLRAGVVPVSVETVPPPP